MVPRDAFCRYRIHQRILGWEHRAEDEDHEMSLVDPSKSSDKEMLEAVSLDSTTLSWAGSIEQSGRSLLPGSPTGHGVVYYRRGAELDSRESNPVGQHGQTVASNPGTIYVYTTWIG